MKTRSETTRLLIALGLGALVFVAGLALARTWIPEWRPGDLPDKSVFVQRYRELAGRLGARLASEPPRVMFETPDSRSQQTSEILDRERLDSPRLRKVGPRLRVVQDAFVPQAGRMRELAIDFSFAGEPIAVVTIGHGWRKYLTDFTQPAPTEELRRALASLLLVSGESLGQPHSFTFAGGAPAKLYPLAGSSEGYLFEIENLGGMVMVTRRIGSFEKAEAESGRFHLAKFLQEGVPALFRYLGVALLFLVLVARGRIDLINGLILAGIAFVISALSAFAGPVSQDELLLELLVAALLALWVFVSWSACESFLRTSDPGFTTSLDSLRAGRLGPRGGRALLHGLALGGALAGLRLLLTAVAMATPGLWPEALSLHLPVFDTPQNPSWKASGWPEQPC